MPEVKRRWVWISDAQSVADGTPSVLAVAETVVASGVGVWLWLRVELYPLLLTSLVMAFLTMLRSEELVALGLKWWMVFEERGRSDKKPATGVVVIVALCSKLIAGGSVYWLAAAWLTGLSGWALFWRAAVLGLLASIIVLAAMVPLAGPTAARIAFAGAVAAAVAGAVAATGTGALAGAVAGIFVGLFLRAILTRVAAPLRHVVVGLIRLPGNWSRLVTVIDIRSEPELVPGLPAESRFKFGKFVADVRSGDASDKVLGILATLILFAPTWLFRLTLNSTFLIYWPLLFVATAPSAYKSEDGTLHWDDARGRRVVDWIAFVLAGGALAGILWSIHDRNFFASFVAWADPRDLPAHVLLQAVSFKVWELDLWEWFALLASAITVILFLWCNAINIRHRGRERQPGWAVLKAVYALGRVQKLLVAATVLTSVFAMVWFVHDTCTLPEGMTEVLTRVLGPPGACVGR